MFFDADHVTVASSFACLKHSRISILEFGNEFVQDEHERNVVLPPDLSLIPQDFTRLFGTF